MTSNDNVVLIDPTMSAVTDALDLFKEGVCMYFDMLEKFPDRFTDERLKAIARDAADEAAQQFTARLKEVRKRNLELRRRRDERDANRQS